eukprot:298138-Pleurochrysis_carterae.AAC.1
MRSPEACTSRKRMGVTQATQSSRIIGAVGARKSKAANTGRQAALHASRCMSVASGDAGL